MTTIYDDNGKIEYTDVKPGQVYKHHSGRIYTVLAITNTAHPSDHFPPTVVYIGANGNYWSRPLTEFEEKFTLLYDGNTYFNKQETQELK